MFEYFNFSEAELDRRAEHERVRREQFELLRAARLEQRLARRQRANRHGKKVFRDAEAGLQGEAVCSAIAVKGLKA